MKNPSKSVRVGVVASLAVRPRGRIRIVLDDVKKSSAGWRTIHLYTWKDLLARDLEEMSVSERDLANLGLAVLARLRATWEQQRLADRDRRAKPTGRRVRGR